MKRFLKKEFLLIPGLLTLLLITAFYDVIFLQKTFKVTTANSQALPTGAYGQENNKPKFIPVNGTDSPVQEEPLYAFIKSNLRRGILPLWNPHQACGYPLIGMIETGMFFPLMFILYLLPDLYGWDVMILVRILLAGCLTFWFMRTVRFRTLPALGAAIAFMLSGPLLLLQYWTTNVDIMLPLILLATERLIRRSTTKNTALLALTITLCMLGGHPENVVLVNGYAFCFFVYRLLMFKNTVPARTIIGRYLFACALAFGLSAFITFPFVKNMLFEFWHGHPKDVGLLLEENPSRALSLALPYFFQKVPLTYQWMFSGWWGGYIGTLPFALACLSLFRPQRRHINTFFALMAFLIISKEYALPYINWIGALPVLNMFRFASHTPSLAAFSMAVLAGMGIRSALSARHIFLKGLPFFTLLLALIAWNLLRLKPPSTLPTALQASALAVSLLLALQGILFCRNKNIVPQKITGLFLIALLFSELFLYIHRERPYRFLSFGPVPYIDFLRSSPQRARSYGNFWAFYPNTASGFEVDDLGFFFGLVPKRFVPMVNTLLVPNLFQGDLRPPALRAIPIPFSEDILNLLNVTYIIRPADEKFENQFKNIVNPTKNYNLVYKNKVKIYQRPHAYPRAFIVHKALFIPDDNKALLALKHLGDKTRQIAVLNHAPIPQIAQWLKDTPLSDRSQVQIKHYSANEVHLAVLMESPGLVVLSDAYHPDWKVTVNGKEDKLFLTDSFIRSVFLPAGKYDVKFTFAPASFYTGCAVSLLSLIILLGAVFIPFSRIKEKLFKY